MKLVISLYSINRLDFILEVKFRSVKYEMDFFKYYLDKLHASKC
jgi:hypothetical protein